MTLANTTQTYGGVTKTFHWLTVLLIFTLIPLGIIANALPYETSEELAQKAFLFSIHKTLGVFTFFVALARILWAYSQPKPGLLHPDRKMESIAAETVHWLLYGSLLLVPLSGWVHHAATTGFAPIWWPFGQNLPFVPKDESIANTFAGLHVVFERVLVLSLFLHIAGALKHHFVDKDVTLKRMWFGQVRVPEVASEHRLALPFGAALSAWAAAILIGGSLGVYQGKGSAVEAAQLAQVQSGWQVEDGTLGIEVVQLGSAVQGSFTDWTAAIDFDPEVTEGPSGTVDVTVSIGSLELGSVKEQAMGADYFNVAEFPTANFVADIVTLPDGYEARGNLTMKGTTIPATLPFTLQLDGSSAAMEGRLIIDRRDFAIGMGMTDESSLGFDVVVNVSLNATQ